MLGTTSSLNKILPIEISAFLSHLKMDELKIVTCLWPHIPLPCHGKKTVVFHFNFGCEVVANVRHDNWSRYSMDNLRLADKALGRIKD